MVRWPEKKLVRCPWVKNPIQYSPHHSSEVALGRRKILWGKKNKNKKKNKKGKKMWKKKELKEKILCCLRCRLRRIGRRRTRMRSRGTRHNELGSPW